MKLDTTRRWLSPREAAACLPGEHHVNKIIRWILEGLLVEGRHLHLKAVKVGGRWLIDVRDLEAFLTAVNSDRGQPTDELQKISLRASRLDERSARRRHRQAKKRLKAMGVL